MRISVMLAAAACAAVMSGPAAAQTAIGSTARASIIGAVLGGRPGAEIGREMDGLAQRLREGLVEGDSVERVGEGVAVSLGSGALFTFNADLLLPGGRARLRTIAEALKARPGTEVLIVVHTDSRGDADDNMGLSHRRAEAARAYLVAQGVESARIRAAGRGGTEPVASNETDAGRQANRRVELAIFAGESRREAALAGS